jgi:hypothetical protein
MPHLFAIVLCVLILAGLSGLVRLEYKLARKGPRMSAASFLRSSEEAQPRSTSDPRPANRTIQHEIGY